MANLRTNNLSGEQGQNAYRGSVFFSGNGSALRAVESDSNLTFGTGDFTIEFWILRTNTNQAVYLDWRNQGGNQGHRVTLYNPTTGSGDLYLYTNGGNRISVSNGISSINSWHHVALARENSSTKLFVNGLQVGSTYTDGSGGTPNDYVGPQDSGGVYIGRYSGGSYDTSGYISNLRIVKGTAVYTANFTPPNTRLPVIDGTVLLTCTSPGNVSKTEGGNDVQPSAKNNNSTPPVASSFTPNSPVGFSTTTDVGSQYGTTFDGFGSFATSSYMVPPAGNTRERNRGRAVLGGGFDTSPGAQTTDMQFFEVQSQGNTQTFGDLTQARWIPAAYASSTRACFAGGGSPSRVNTIDFVTIATTSNATNFGDLTSTRTYFMGYSSSTRGIAAGGGDPSLSDVIDYVTIATAGDATDFGNLTVARQEVMSACSPTRGLTMGGFLTPNPSTDVVDYVTIASTGNAIDFGDLTAASGHGAATSDNTRVIFAGGYSPGTTYSNKIEFFTTASTGNGTDFGDLITAVISAYGMPSDNTRGVLCGGFVSPANINSMQQITIQTTGDAVDFGDVTVKKRGNGGTSDSHGGLS